MPGLVAAFLTAFGNAKSLLVPTAAPEQPWPGLALGAALVLLALAWARAGAHLTAMELGLERRRAGRAALVGGIAALALGVAALGALRAPALLGAQPIGYFPATEMTTEALLLRAFVLMPLDTAIPEELAFRGVLLGWLRRHGDALRAAVASSGAFALWHIVIVAATVPMTNTPSDPLLAALTVTGALIAVFCGGLFFSWLRERTGSLAAPIVAHAIFNATLLVGLAAA